MDVRTTARKNHELDDMVLRIQIDIRVNPESDDGITALPELDDEPPISSVSPFSSRLTVECNSKAKAGVGEDG